MTKQHSRNSVEAAFRIELRDYRRGESITLNLHPSPWPNRYICSDGIFSAAHVGKSITLMLTQ